MRLYIASNHGFSVPHVMTLEASYKYFDCHIIFCLLSSETKKSNSVQ